jgi:predicted GNAT family acetyltransferase
MPGVTGEVGSVEEFVPAWATETGAPSRLNHSLRMYRVDAVTAPQSVKGSARLANAGDGALLARWLTQFRAEAETDNAAEDVDLLVKRRLAHYKTWLWYVEGAPVSLAGCSHPAAGLARVGPVYTPTEHRRHGYGAAVTAHATQEALDTGADQVVLYTDLANPTSNAIYQGIGYLPDHDAEERSFAHGTE